MPRNVRNFWVEANIEGRRTMLSGGPQGKLDGLHLYLYQRDKGDITTALRVHASADRYGALTLAVFGPDGQLIFEHETER